MAGVKKECRSTRVYRYRCIHIYRIFFFPLDFESYGVYSSHSFSNFLKLVYIFVLYLIS